MDNTTHCVLHHARHVRVMPEQYAAAGHASSSAVWKPTASAITINLINAATTNLRVGGSSAA